MRGPTHQCIDKENVVMGKKGKIIIALSILIVGVFVGVLVIGTLGYVLFSRRTGNAELIFPATEVGTPVGGKITKNIGSAGGTLTSPDGKLTLTVPKDAVEETVSFSIQPITNTASNGLGNGCRLEPSGMKFRTPVEVSVQYDENDLKGTVPEALGLAYQDDKGAWHSPTHARLDQEKRTITVSTTHFSDWVYLALLRIIPTDARVHVGETQFIKIALACPPTKLFDWYFHIDCSRGVYTDEAEWELRGEGTLTRFNESSGVVYTAPASMPVNKHASVELNIVIFNRNELTGELSKDPKTFATWITIVGGGYRASGQDGPTNYSGVVCSLDEPFTITGQNALVALPLKFVPLSGTAGTLSYTASYKMLTMAGEGTYTIEGADSDNPRILAQTKSTLSGIGRTTSGGGPAHINLTPLDTDECSKKP